MDALEFRCRLTIQNLNKNKPEQDVISKKSLNFAKYPIRTASPVRGGKVGASGSVVMDTEVGASPRGWRGFVGRAAHIPGKVDYRTHAIQA